MQNSTGDCSSLEVEDRREKNLGQAPSNCPWIACLHSNTVPDFLQDVMSMHMVRKFFYAHDDEGDDPDNDDGDDGDGDGKVTMVMRSGDDDDDAHDDDIVDDGDSGDYR